MILSIREEGDEGLARIANYWHEFANTRGLSSLQRSCEDLLIDSFCDAQDDQQRQNRIERLKRIKLAQLDLSGYPNESSHLTYIAQLPLKELNLSSKLIEDGKLALLKGLPLETLILNNNLISDNDLIHLQNFTNLQVLNLSYYHNITGKGFTHLKNLPLQQLMIDHLVMEPLTDEAIAYLKNFENLQMLALDISRENLLVHLADLPKLRILHLKVKQGFPTHLTHLKKLPLEELRLLRGYFNIVGSDLESLAGLPLKKLWLESNRNIQDDALVHLKRFPLLEELILKGNMTNAGLTHLGHLSLLKKLNLSGGKRNLTAACLSHLQNLSLLEDLYLNVPKGTQKDLSCLKNLPLKRLVLSVMCDWLTDEHLIPLQHLRLKELHLSRCIKIKNFSFLKNMPLQTLCLEWATHLKDEDLSNLKDLPLLQLSLPDCENLNGSGLVYLKDSPLRELCLFIGPEFDYKNLVFLKDLKNLQILVLLLYPHIEKKEILPYLNGLSLKRCDFRRYLF